MGRGIDSVTARVGLLEGQVFLEATVVGGVYVIL